MTISTLESLSSLLLSIFLQTYPFADANLAEWQRSWSWELATVGQHSSPERLSLRLSLRHIDTERALLLMNLVRTDLRDAELQNRNVRSPLIWRERLVLERVFEVDVSGPRPIILRWQEEGPMERFRVANFPGAGTGLKALFSAPWDSEDRWMVMVPFNGLAQGYSGEASLSAPPLGLTAVFENGLPVQINLLDMSPSMAPEGGDATVARAAYVFPVAGR